MKKLIAFSLLLIGLLACEPTNLLKEDYDTKKNANAESAMMAVLKKIRDNGSTITIHNLCSRTQDFNSARLYTQIEGDIFTNKTRVNVGELRINGKIISTNNDNRYIGRFEHSDYFGTTAALQLGELTTDFNIVKPLFITTYITDNTIALGNTIAWVADSNNQLGIVFEITGNNFSGIPITNRIIVADNGSYTFTAADFSDIDVSKGTLQLVAYRGTFKEITLTSGKKISLVSYSNVIMRNK